MAKPHLSTLVNLRRWLITMMTGAPALAFLPALSLAAFWLSGEGTLIIVSVILPLAYLLAGGLNNGLVLPRDAVSGLLQRSAFEELTNQIYLRTGEKGRKSAAFFLAIEGFQQLSDRHGQAAADTIVQRKGERLVTELRR